MYKVLLAATACLLFAPINFAAPGVVRCGKLLDVCSGGTVVRNELAAK
jgi:hypothetical protein